MTHSRLSIGWLTIHHSPSRREPPPPSAPGSCPREHAWTLGLPPAPLACRGPRSAWRTPCLQPPPGPIVAGRYGAPRPLFVSPRPLPSRPPPPAGTVYRASRAAGRVCERRAWGPLSIASSVRAPPSGEQQSVATPGREKIGSPTLQPQQDPILLLPWLCFEVADQTLTLTHNPRAF